jgi:hypothetical protein
LLPAGATAELKAVSDWEQSGEALDADFTLKIPNFATSTGRRLMLPSGIFHSSEKQPFQTSQRVHPVYFGYPFYEADEISLRLPPGKRVESLPNAPPQLAEFATYEATCQIKRESIELRRKVVMKRSYFDLDYYPALHVFFWLVKEGDERQVVLENVPTAQAAQHN